MIIWAKDEWRLWLMMKVKESWLIKNVHWWESLLMRKSTDEKVDFQLWRQMDLLMDRHCYLLSCYCDWKLAPKLCWNFYKNWQITSSMEKMVKPVFGHFHANFFIFKWPVTKIKKTQNLSTNNDWNLFMPKFGWLGVAKLDFPRLMMVY